MSRQKPEKGELIWAETFLFAIVCAPKGTPKENVIAFASQHHPGTSAGWVLIDEEGKQNPVQCPDFEDREHWQFNC